MSRVLVVDDIQENVYLLRALLQGHGHQVEEARHGVDALTQARQFLPELVVSDLLMPVMDGYTLLREWKRDERLKVVPFVVYTATYTDPEDEKLALDLGAEAFIVKPVEPEVLLARLQDVMAKCETNLLLQTKQPVESEVVLLKEYSEVLVRKLEDKALQLERANRELADREARLRTIVDTEPEGVMLLLADGTVLEMNRAGLRMIEADSFDEGKGRDFCSLVEEEYRVAFSEFMQKVFGGESGTMEFPLTGLKAGRRWLETHAAPLRDDHNCVSALLGVTRDITERRRIEQSLHLFRAQVENANDAIEVVDPETGRFLDMNQRGYLDLGYTRNEILKLTVPDIDPRMDLATIHRNTAIMRETGGINLETEHRRKDGTVFPVEVAARLVRLDREYVVTVARDITERKRAAVALATRARQQSEVAELGQWALSGMAIQKLFEHTVVKISETFGAEFSKVLELLPDGKTLKLVAGVGWKAGLVGNATLGVERESQAGYTLLSKTPVVVEDLRAETRFSGPQVLHDHGVISGLSLVIGKLEQPYGALGVHCTHQRTFTQDDVNFIQSIANVLAEAIARKRAEDNRQGLEAQLRQAQKMKALGTLAGGVAHDFNNVVGSILVHADLARHKVGDGHPAATDLALVTKAGERARNLVRQILAFGRKQPQQLRRQALRPLIEEALALIRGMLPSTVRLDVFLADEPLHALVDPTQFGQVMTNLCTNAWHALSDRAGRVEIRLDAITVGEASSAMGATKLAPGRYACISVGDNGCGMDEETVARIFEPFFTTKDPSRGTGLGLAVVHGIMAEHGAVINVKSVVNVGTEFELYFRTVETPGGSETLAASSAKLQVGNGEHVLYVDDDEVMVLAAQALLERCGYRVTTSDSGVAALEILRAQPEAFDAVVADYNMPEMNGLDLAHEIHSIKPALPIAITSGYLSDDLRSGAKAASVRKLLNKENTLEQLGNLVHDLLSAEAH